ncbi:beta-L-arabinofuranosidase domain-containing protein [Pelagicoccus albus]|uniref:Glycoside hydrolase family 127 protein n=1 Tax=Pelagicoccus albus TaxID=415222 RepID=A0A7X1E8B6_9BACT|nr:glycoside hydrolase family 127 protein [Pelagicoccus albus]
MIQINSVSEDPGEQKLEISSELPKPRLTSSSLGEVSLLPGLFQERRELTKAYLLRLGTRNLLQNHMLEAGIRIDDPSEKLHQGWEAPHYQLRGHFAGHWLSAATHYAAVDHDPLMAARAREVVEQLEHCQELNGGQWVASIPEEYFAYLVDGRPIWSPQYTLHKTLMGLFDAYRFSGDEEALAVLDKASIWFDDWTRRMIDEGHGKAVYGGECAGMLELWADLYAVTGNERYLKLASRYAMPDLFRRLLEGEDALTNDHANASVPWIQGAARLYEVTGDERYREVVEAFWKQGVEDRGMFATTGSNAGEFWIPPQQFGRFLGSRTQEHCTVYNMIRVADYLYRWTGEARYADYIERALYNGILAQQNPHTGMIAYFLPNEPGSKKVWGTETHDFWCCHGTLVQAQSMYEDLVYYISDEGVTVGQFLASEAAFGASGNEIRIRQMVDTSDRGQNFVRTDELTRFVVELAVESESTDPWVLKIRQPSWAIGKAEITIDGVPVKAGLSDDGSLKIERKWTESTVRVAFSKRLVLEPLPGGENRFALLDGPVVLAALTESEPSLSLDSIVSKYEHQYVSGRDWQSGHYLAKTKEGSVSLVPIYEIADEAYTTYFHGEE